MLPIHKPTLVASMVSATVAGVIFYGVGVVVFHRHHSWLDIVGCWVFCVGVVYLITRPRKQS